TKKGEKRKGSICKECKSLKFNYPEVAKMFDKDKNGYELDLQTVWSFGAGRSHPTPWFRCTHGHSFKITPARLCSRYESNINLCPVCDGSHEITKSGKLKRLPQRDIKGQCLNTGKKINYAVKSTLKSNL
ncbi:MAG: hypothetical protein VX618_03220, partial [Thermodesulfobacteriota bacterium]|nr:hypothetical protein [Thermodesulfobacteriota bacterium]